MSKAADANKALVAYFYRLGENDDVGPIFDRVGGQFDGSSIDFLKCDVNVANFAILTIGELPYPVIQAYVGKLKTSELSGLSDEASINNLVQNALSQVV